MTASTTIVLHVPAGATHFMETFSCTGSTGPSAAVLRDNGQGESSDHCISPPMTWMLHVRAGMVENLDVTVPAGARFTLHGVYQL